MNDHRRAASSTTMSSRLIPALALGVCLVAPPSAEADPVSEAELVRRFLDTAPQRALAAAARAHSRAERAVPPYLRSPELEIRREQAFGEGTAFSTTVAGASLSFEIGGRHGLRARAAALRADAVELRRRSARLESICALRRHIQRAAHAREALELVQRKHKQLRKLLGMLEKLVRSGEKAPFELERTRLLVRSHARTVTGQRADAAAALARLGALTGRAVSGVTLARVAPGPGGGAPGRHTRVRALKLDARAAGVHGEIAGRSWVPDLGIHGAYRLDYAGEAGPGHGYELGLSFNLPFNDPGRVAHAAAAARRSLARSASARVERQVAARAASLRARVAILGAQNPRRAVDLEKLFGDALRRYLGGVSPLGALVDALQAVEAEAARRLRGNQALRGARLELECLQGAFADHALDRIRRAGRGENDEPEPRP